MKKTTLLAALFSIITTLSFAQQMHIGIRLSPSIGTNSVLGDNYSKGGSGFSFSGGLWAELPLIKNNVAFYTGLGYVNKKVLVKYSKGNADTHPNTLGNQKSTTALQNLQIPIAIKFITDEIFDKGKIYILTGVTNDFCVAEKTKFDNNNYKGTSNFFFYDISLLVGAGVEYAISENNSLICGISYNRGFIQQYKGENSDLSINTRIVSLDLGLKF